MKPPNGLTELEARYSKLVLVPDSRGPGLRIAHPIAWEVANMVSLHSLPGGIAKLYVHRDMATPLTEALKAATAACPDYKIRTIGCWNPRFKRTNGKELSVHSWGLAVDINADTNPLAATLTTDLPSAFVQSFKDQGFTWGGEFSGKKDAMHFQWCSGY